MDQARIESLARGIRIKRKLLPDTLGLMQVPMKQFFGLSSHVIGYNTRRDAGQDAGIVTLFEALAAQADLELNRVFPENSSEEIKDERPTN